MPFFSLTDLSDNRLDVFRQLKKSNATRDGLFIAEGKKLVELLLNSTLRIHSLLVDPRHAEMIRNQAPADLPVFVLDHQHLEQLVGFNFHRGMLACGYRPPQPSLAELVEPLAQPRRLVICPSIQDPENLGAVIRIGLAFGIHGLILGPKSADPFSRRVLRVSMGNAFQLPILTTNDLNAVMSACDQAHIETVATVLDKHAEPLETFPISDRWAMLLGNEGHGLEPEWATRAHRRVTIPMQNDVDSLNVAVAAGIFLYRFRDVTSTS